MKYIKFSSSGLLYQCLSESSSTVFHVSVLCSLGVELLLLSMLGIHVYLTARQVVRIREEIAPHIITGEGVNNADDVHSYEPHPYLRRSLSHHIYNQVCLV